MVITLVFTDRNGRRLMSREFRGDYAATRNERAMAIAELCKELSDHAGVPPYVFTSIRSGD